MNAPRGGKWTCSSPQETKVNCAYVYGSGAAGVPADSFTGSQAGFQADGNHGSEILSVDPYRVRDSVDKGRVAVVAGAQGMSTGSNVTFLGRGGSDTTAVALAHGLGAGV